MKDQVVMSPNNGALCIAIPLYRRHYSEDLGKPEGFSISLSDDKPLMYAIDYGQETIQAFNAEWVEENLEFLGEL